MTQKRITPYRSHRYNINSDFFKDWSHEMAYVLGLVASDGSIYIEGRQRRLEFMMKDKELLESVRDAMGSEHPIRYKVTLDKRMGKYRDIYQFRICSKEICSDLINIGIRPNKSLTLEYPLIPKEFNPDFIRGVFDGDGGVYLLRGHIFVHISGNYTFLDTLRLILNDNNINSRVYDSRNGCFKLTISKNSNVKKFYEYIYQNDRISLKRKKSVFDEFFGKNSIVNRSLKDYTNLEEVVCLDSEST